MFKEHKDEKKKTYQQPVLDVTPLIFSNKCNRGTLPSVSETPC